VKRKATEDISNNNGSKGVGTKRFGSISAGMASSRDVGAGSDTNLVQFRLVDLLSGVAADLVWTVAADLVWTVAPADNHPRNSDEALTIALSQICN
jgi:hypothetical protein